MPYCTVTDLKSELSEAELIELTDDDSAGVVGTTIINDMIAKSDAKIDFNCGQQVDVPFSPTPPIVKEWSKTLTVYHLFLRKQAVPQKIEDAAKEIFDILKLIAKGSASIPGVASGDEGGEPRTSGTADDRIITMGKKSDGSSGSLDNY